MDLFTPIKTKRLKTGFHSDLDGKHITEDDSEHWPETLKYVTRWGSFSPILEGICRKVPRRPALDECTHPLSF